MLRPKQSMAKGIETAGLEWLSDGCLGMAVGWLPLGWLPWVSGLVTQAVAQSKSLGARYRAVDGFGKKTTGVFRLAMVGAALVEGEEMHWRIGRCLCRSCAGL